MKLNTRNFGDIEIDDDKIIEFEEGLPGFEHLHQFVFVDSEEGVFNYLQAVEDRDICFIITSPYTFMESYAPRIQENYFEKLGGGATEDFTLFSIVCLRRPLETSTMNLAAPILIQTEHKKGIQVILEDKKYTAKYKFMEKKEKREETACSH